MTEEDKQAIWGEKEPDRIVVITRNPYAWFAYALQIIFPQEQPEPGVDTRAVVEDGAVIDSTATVEAGAVIRKAHRSVRTALSARTASSARAWFSANTLVFIRT